MDTIQTNACFRRCAIYTRKSSQPPTAQEITSLESQRTICSAYIASQQHRGWQEIPKIYEDAGRSGGDLKRPALQALLGDIEMGAVDVVIVYKMDRITRTLLDFIRLIDLFDRYGVTFVAITQNFDTSDSMGRLVRNILLTFAQFEREIAGDRIRDKKRVMKQRGFWTGGNPPTGYDLRRGKLVINPFEEPAIRCIFETYVETGRLSAVHRRLVEGGFRRKSWRTKTGAVRGGKAISLSALHHIISNPVYVGDVTHYDERHPGLHTPIIERDLWDRAQKVLEERRAFKPRQPSNLLTGILFDDHGRRMHARTNCNARGIYRSYASAFAAWAARQKIKKVRVRADPLERLILESLKVLLCDRRDLRLLLAEAGVRGIDIDQLARLGPAAGVRLDSLPIRHLCSVTKALLQRVEVHSTFVRVSLRPEAIAGFVAWDGVGLFGLSEANEPRPQQLHVFDIPAAVKRERNTSLLPVTRRPVDSPDPCPRLLRLLDDASQAQDLLYRHRDISLADLAYSLGRKPASFARLIRLNYLAPDITTAIIDGTQPPTLTRKALASVDLPNDWKLQRRLLGFPPMPGEDSAMPSPKLIAAATAGGCDQSSLP